MNPSDLHNPYFPPAADPEAIALHAITYLLKHIKHNRDVAKVIGFGTKSYTRLIAAKAALERKPIWHVELEMQKKSVIPFPGCLKTLDLKPFLGKLDNEHNLHLSEPSSCGQYSYATTGTILIRFPRNPAVPERTEFPSGAAEDNFIKFFPENGRWIPLPSLPPDDSEDDNYPLPTWGVVSRDFDSDLFRRLALLPGIEIAPYYGSETEPMPFRFAAGLGEGLIMPFKPDPERRVDAVIVPREVI